MATNTSSAQSSCNISMATNPDGAPPNFVHRDMFQPITIGTITTFSLILIVFVGLRIYGTLRKERKLFFDDYVCLTAFMLAITFGCLEARISHGYTHHWNMSVCQVKRIQTDPVSAGGMLMYPLTILSAKAVICALYLRIFESIRWIRYTTWTILVFYTLTCLAGFFLYLSHFIMVKFSVEEAGPITLKPYIMLITAATVLVDLTLLSLPIRPILQMHALSLRKRFSLLAVFLAGFGATTCTIVLLYYNRRYLYPRGPNDMFDRDWTWKVNIMNLLVAVEADMTITLGCVPGVVAAWRYDIRNTWLIIRIRSALGISGTDSSQEKDLGDLEGGDGKPDETLKVRNNDRTLRLETI